MTTGESVATAVAQTVDGVVAGAEAAIENAEARIAVADATNAALSEAAIRDRITQHVSELEQDILECREEFQSQRLTLAEVTGIRERQAAIETTLQALSNQILALQTPPAPLTPAASAVITETTQTTITPANQSADAGAPPAVPTKSNRFRLA